MAGQQIPLLITDSTVVYRAYTKELLNGRVSDFDFRLRPIAAPTSGPWLATEEGLSVATDPDKAMSEIRCRGCVPLVVGNIQRIPGLNVVIKDASEPFYWEIRGIPVDDYASALDFAIALAKIAGDPMPHPERWKRSKT